MIRLSDHFTLDEFLRSQTAARMGRSIVPTDKQKAALRALVTNTLQPVRDLLGVPIVITSGLRPEWLNSAIGGSPTSQHMEGKAADLVPVGISVRDAATAIAVSGIEYDQLILEFDEWLHISWDHSCRCELLTARFADGATSYSKGIV